MGAVSGFGVGTVFTGRRPRGEPLPAPPAVPELGGTNEVGAAFKTGLIADRFSAGQDGRATLIWDGTNWVILKIE